MPWFWACYTGSLVLELAGLFIILIRCFVFGFKTGIKEVVTAIESDNPKVYAWKRNDKCASIALSRVGRNHDLLCMSRLFQSIAAKERVGQWVIWTQVTLCHEKKEKQACNKEASTCFHSVVKRLKKIWLRSNSFYESLDSSCMLYNCLRSWALLLWNGHLRKDSCVARSTNSTIIKLGEFRDFWINHILFHFYLSIKEQSKRRSWSCQNLLKH